MTIRFVTNRKVPVQMSKQEHAYQTVNLKDSMRLRSIAGLTDLSPMRFFDLERLVQEAAKTACHYLREETDSLPELLS